MQGGVTVLTIDGSYLEGGGQIVRVAVGLSAVTGIPCRIVDIRQGRRRPGLAPQHVAAIEGASKCCGARVKGAIARSETLEFEPGVLDQQKRLRLRVGTAGSVTLVLQAVLIPLVASGRKSTVEVHGGTHVPWSPVLEYFREIFGWWVGRMGVPLRVDSVRPGFYPQGDGQVSVTVSPASLRPIEIINRGAHCETAAWSIASEDLEKRQVAERQVRGLSEAVHLDRVKQDYRSSASTGTAVCAVACYQDSRIGGSALGKKGKPAEDVGAECAGLLRKQMDSGAAVDEHMADQILPYLALAGGDSTVSVAAITDHCRTSAWLLEQFLPVQFSFDDSAGMIHCMSETD